MLHMLKISEWKKKDSGLTNVRRNICITEWISLLNLSVLSVSGFESFSNDKTWNEEEQAHPLHQIKSLENTKLSLLLINFK